MCVSIAKQKSGAAQSKWHFKVSKLKLRKNLFAEREMLSSDVSESVSR